MLISENCNELILIVIQLNMDYQQLVSCFLCLLFARHSIIIILYANCFMEGIPNNCRFTSNSRYLRYQYIATNAYIVKPTFLQKSPILLLRQFVVNNLSIKKGYSTVNLIFNILENCIYDEIFNSQIPFNKRKYFIM